jgi:hypothetical protein
MQSDRNNRNIVSGLGRSLSLKLYANHQIGIVSVMATSTVPEHVAYQNRDWQRMLSPRGVTFPLLIYSTGNHSTDSLVTKEKE